MSDKNYAMGHAFSLHDTFMNFPVEKLKMTTEQCKETYSDGSKRDLAASIFARSAQIVVEDIIDTGNTLEELKNIFKDKNLKHLKIATLFFKPEAYKKDIKIDYVGIRIPSKFIVGYGLDYDGLGRNLPDVYQLAE